MTTHGGITQLVEYPVHTRYVICSNQIAATRPVGQAVKTPPFHGGNMGSIPVRVTMKNSPHHLVRAFFIHGITGIEPIQCKCPVGICRPPAGRRAHLSEIDSRTGHHEKNRTHHRLNGMQFILTCRGRVSRPDSATAYHSTYCANSGGWALPEQQSNKRLSEPQKVVGIAAGNAIEYG